MNEGYINTTTDLVIPVNQDLTISSQPVKMDLPKYWDKDYVNQCINNVSNPTHKMLFKFMWMSGVRVSEAISLRKKDIDFENYVMNIRWLKSRKYNHRVVPLHPLLKDLLQLYSSPLKFEDKLFNMSRQRVWQLCKKCFVGHPHQIRHSFAVNWLRCGGDIIILHRMLGHSKVQTTMEYLKIVPVDQGKELMKIQF